METILLIIVYLSIGLTGYVYVGYPIILWLFTKFFPAKAIEKGSYQPPVTLIISCYNEEDVIASKIENSINLAYPKELLDIIVVSDGSTDKTDDIVQQYAEKGVRLIRQEGRLGKTMGLNLATPQANGNIVVFSDANAMYHPDAVSRLLENFSDLSVGYVVGEAQYINLSENTASSNENAYWNYEISIKKMETCLHSVVGGDGAIYAIRKELFEELKDTDINDFVNPLQIISKGYRGVYEASAIATEDAAGSYSKEFKRKIRIVNRAFTGLFRVKEVMNPFRTGFFSFQIISHKLLRWLVPYYLCIIALSSIGLSLLGSTYGHILSGLTFLILLTILISWRGYKKDYNWPSVLFLPYYFAIVNLAAFAGVLRSFQGNVQVTWDTVRSEATDNSLKNNTILIIFLIVSLLLCTGIFILGYYKGTANIISFVFWLSFSVLFYVYAGYPLTLHLWSSFSKDKVAMKDIYPSVTLLVCAYNEEEVIAEKIDNSLRLHYPGKLNIYIVSDGSTDRTPQIINEKSNDRITFFDYNTRRGKIGALLKTIPKIQSEIIVFSDANTMYDSDVMSKLIRNFADPQVGGVSGDVILQNSKTSFGYSESLYYKYERAMQRAESKIGSIIGADGGMYAIRRDLFVPPSPKTILDDFVISMNIALQGYKVIYEDEAKGYETNIISCRAEFVRKSRIIAGAIQSIIAREGVPAFNQCKLLFCYLSHKVLRWITPLLLIALFVANSLLCVAPTKSIYFITLGAQIVFYLSALAGYICRRKEIGKIFAIPFYYCLENAAALYGVYKGVFNKQKVTWQTFSRTEPDRYS